MGDRTSPSNGGHTNKHTRAQGHVSIIVPDFHSSPTNPHKPPTMRLCDPGVRNPKIREALSWGLVGLDGDWVVYSLVFPRSPSTTTLKRTSSPWAEVFFGPFS